MKRRGRDSHHSMMIFKEGTESRRSADNFNEAATERARFELARILRPYTLSRRAVSTTHAPLRFDSHITSFCARSPQACRTVLSERRESKDNQLNAAMNSRGAFLAVFGRAANRLNIYVTPWRKGGAEKVIQSALAERQTHDYSTSERRGTRKVVCCEYATWGECSTEN